MAVLRMVRPTLRKGSTVFQFRPRVPADILDKVKGESLSLLIGGELHSVTVNERISVTLDTRDPQEAQRRMVDVMSQVAAFFERTRNTASPLSHRQRVAFAGAMRAFVIDQFDEEPLTASKWQLFAPIAERLLSGDLNDSRDGVVLSPHAAVVSFFGPTIAEVSARSGIQPSAADYELLVPLMVRAMNEAAAVTVRKAEGDYGKDDGASSYPSLEPMKEPKTTPVPKLTLSALFTLWEDDHRREGRTEKTIEDYRRKVTAFKVFLEHDNAEKVTSADVGRWAKHLSDEAGLSASTINGKYLAAVGSIYSSGRNAGVYEQANPTSGIRRRKPRTVSTRSTGYTTDEATRILRASLCDPINLGRRPIKTKLAIRWGPWICAHTGCRVTEAMQLRNNDLTLHEGVLTFRFTPDAGSIKTGNHRYVPVHSQLIDLGIEQAFRDAPTGPMFFEPKKTPEEAHKAAENVGDKVRRWLKESPETKVTGIQPNHAWRHRFITLSREAGIEDQYSKAITGHSRSGGYDGYGEKTMRALKRSIEQIPRYTIR